MPDETELNEAATGEGTVLAEEKPVEDTKVDEGKVVEQAQAGEETKVGDNEKGGGGNKVGDEEKLAHEEKTGDEEKVPHEEKVVEEEKIGNEEKSDHEETVVGHAEKVGQEENVGQEKNLDQEEKVGQEEKEGHEDKGDGEPKVGEEVPVGAEELDGEGKIVEGGTEEAKGEGLEDDTAKKKRKIKTQIEINEFGEEVMIEVEEEEIEETEKTKEEEKPEEVVEEEEYVEPPPPDPTAPYDITDSKEALRPSFEFTEQQLAELEQLWELYQDHTPAYSDIDGYITEKELVYMLQALILMTYTPEQLVELIEYYVRPPHPEGQITYDQFLNIVKHRLRDIPVEEELKNALKVMDYNNTGSIDRELLKEVLSKKGYKMSQKHLINLLKEVDIANDGTIGVEDVVGTMAIDMNSEDIQLLQDNVRALQMQLTGEPPPPDDGDDDEAD